MDYQLDRHIIESWRRHEQAEPHISTERLMDMVRVDTGARRLPERIAGAGRHVR